MGQSQPPLQRMSQSRCQHDENEKVWARGIERKPSVNVEVKTSDLLMNVRRW